MRDPWSPTSRRKSAPRYGAPRISGRLADWVACDKLSLRRKAMKILRLVLPIALLAASVATFAKNPPKRPMSFEDMMTMKRLGETAMSPDGKWLGYGVTSVDLAKNTKTNELFIQEIAGGEPKKIEVAQPNDSGLEFSHDGHFVLFLSD